MSKPEEDQDKKQNNIPKEPEKKEKNKKTAASKKEKKPRKGLFAKKSSPSISDSDSTLPKTENPDNKMGETEVEVEEKTSSTMETDEPVDEQIRENPENEPAFHVKPTVPRVESQDSEGNITSGDSLETEYPGDIVKPDVDSESFIKKVSTSIEEDQRRMEPDKIPHQENPDQEILASEPVQNDLVDDLEAEIDQAADVSNPFEETLITEKAKKGDESFLANLEEVFPEETKEDESSADGSDEKKIGPFDLTDDQNISSENWEQVLSATEEEKQDYESSEFLKRFDPHYLPPLEEDWVDDIDFGTSGDLSEPESTESSSEPEEEDAESLSELRRSYIEEFEQSPWPEEEPEEEKSWFGKRWASFRSWITSLNTSERILIVMSALISIAVLVAIVLVVFQWQGIGTGPAEPPEPINVANLTEVYPTGLQLPGGWFFFLEQGRIENNRWDPQNAEWLPGTTVRRVVAIPWSRQAEAVVQSLEQGNEIQLFFNNNDVISFYVDEVQQVSRDNVRILTDTEPSLAVILFRNDNRDRWVIIARP